MRVEAFANSQGGSGTFKLTAAGQASGPIAYSSNTTTLASNIQSALVANNAIGAGNVAVTFDAARSSATSKGFRIDYLNDRSLANVSDLIADSAGLTHVQAVAKAALIAA